MPWALAVLPLLLPYHVALLPATGVLLLVALAHPPTRRRLLHATPLDPPIALLLVAFAVSTVFSAGDRLEEAHADLHLAGGIALFYLAANTLTSFRDVRRVIAGIACVGGVTAIGAMLERLAPNRAAPVFAALGGSPHYFPGHRLLRVTAAMTHPNVLAQVLAVAILLLGGLLLGFLPAVLRGGHAPHPGPMKAIALPALLLLPGALAEALVLTYSRGGVIALLAGLAVLLAATLLGPATRPRWRRAAGLAAVVVLVAAGSLVWDPTFAERMSDVVRPDYGPNSERLLLWRGALAIASHHPVAGVGPDDFESIWDHPSAGGVRQLQGHEGVPGYHAHNLFLQLAACVGIGGAVAVAWLISAALLLGAATARRCSDRRLTALVVGCTAALAAVLVQGLVDYFWQAPAAVALFWLLPGLLVAAARIEGTAGGRLATP